MLTGLVVTLVTALITFVVGAPLAARLARFPQIQRKRAPLDPITNQRMTVVRNFEPLDFGPSTLYWPSESDRVLPSFPVPPWPSANWDDPDFGRAPSESAPSAAAISEERDRRRRERAREARRQEEADRVRAQKERQARQQQAEAEARAQRQAQQTARRKRQGPSPQERVQQAVRRKRQGPSPQERIQRAAQRPPPPATSEGSSPEGGPSPEELEALIQDRGLAGTVQYLMQRHGWDFKAAAAWIARNRKS